MLLSHGLTLINSDMMGTLFNRKERKATQEPDRHSAFIRVVPWPKFHILCCLCLFVAIPIFAAPRIECDAPKYDFGTVIGQEQITHEFIIWNKGDEPLKILKIKNCCGTKSTVVPMVIAPGSNAVCTTVFTTKNRYGSQDKQILLETNDKKHLYYDLRMTGTLLKPVEFQPRWVRLNNLLPDSSVSETIMATNLLEKAVTLESVSTTLKGLEARITKSQDRSWTIQLTSTAPLALGQINGNVRLSFSTGAVDVPVFGQVKPIIQPTPEVIKFSNESTDEVTRMVMLRSGDDRTFVVLSATLESADGTVAFKKLAEGKWKITLNIQPSTIRSDSSVVIKTSLESQDTIIIPLSRK